MGVKRKQHSADFKARVAMAALSGEKSLAGTVVGFGVARSDDRAWKQELIKRAKWASSRAATRRRRSTMREGHRKIGQLQVERDFRAGSPPSPPC